MAKDHDLSVGEVSKIVVEELERKYPVLRFRYRSTITKAEINTALRELDPTLGQVLFVDNASIMPDGGIVEVEDDNGKWRVILVSEAKYQGKDIENIKRGELVGRTMIKI